ncbi:MAG: gamma-glutamyltransferase [Fimbriimonadales bacterium]
MRCAALAITVYLSATSFSQGIWPTRAKQELVISDSAIASQVGAEILKKGGNAVDAAVATGFALAVTFPGAGNIGGGGFMLVRMADGRQVALDFREIAPRAASKDMYLDRSGKVIPKASLVGYRAAGVPGTVAGLWEAHHRFGKLPWREVVEPARKLAAEGFAVSYEFAKTLFGNRTLFSKFPETSRVFSRDGRYFEWGETFKQPDLAATLGRIRDQGPKDFYEGKTARLIAADMKLHGGLITLEDLRTYKVELRQPLTGQYRDYQVVTMPPPSSGGVALIEMLNILQGYDLKAMGFGSAACDHVEVEAMKRAFADRSEYMGDPGFVKVPVAQLIDPAYAAKLRDGISLERDTPSAGIHPGAGIIKEGDHTTHYSVVDKDGNAAATTYTLNTGFGCGVVVKGAGFFLNDEMDDFASKVGVPNTFGLIQGEANTIRSGKRPLSSMTPTIVLKDGKLFMVLGSPGGPTIINTVLQTIINVVDHGMNVQEAVSAPRIHHQWLPDRISWEPRGLSADVIRAMEGAGHQFAKPALIGSCHAIMIDPKTGFRFGAVDPRVEGAGAAGR